jgi:hypothetical protein
MEKEAADSAVQLLPRHAQLTSLLAEAPVKKRAVDEGAGPVVWSRGRIRHGGIESRAWPVRDG